jgi:hypothetical protein
VRLQVVIHFAGAGGLQPAQVVVNGNRFTPRGAVKQLKSYCHGGVLHSAALCSAAGRAN